ncbi:hypothetical protein F5X97DRAFT_289901 [Nemania serpens]|nr:hypothetical protein F5X97DRAFT_289901 [Nemania serpens]
MQGVFAGGRRRQRGQAWSFSKVEDTKICVVMVGLPARGKSYIAQRGSYSSRP